MNDWCATVFQNSHTLYNLCRSHLLFCRWSFISLCSRRTLSGPWWVRQLNFLTSPVCSINQSVNHAPHLSQLGTNDHFGNAGIKRGRSPAAPFSNHPKHLGFAPYRHLLQCKADKPTWDLLSNPAAADWSLPPSSQSPEGNTLWGFSCSVTD